MTSFHQTYQQFQNLSTDTSFSTFDLPWNAVDVQSDSEFIQMFAENGSDVSLKFLDNSLLTPEQLNKCQKVDPRKSDKIT